MSLATPEPRLDRAFAWAKVGIDKGLATNPALGTGLVAGFRSSGDSERPGFAWFFGRDALWTALATTSYGDLATTRLALSFLRRFQREDGKLPHEISQSASLVPWFDRLSLSLEQRRRHAALRDRPRRPLPRHRRPRLPRGVLALDPQGLALHGGDRHRRQRPGREHRASATAGWRAARSTRRTRRSTCRGCGSRPVARSPRWPRPWATPRPRRAARDAAERTRAAVERTYWLDGRGFYAFATARPRQKPPEAEPGPYRARRQARLEALAQGGLVDEDTVLPAVPLWWGTLDEARAQSEIDHLGAAALATDWGQRILADGSELYDPLSYHYGSVWPLFTGWTVDRRLPLRPAPRGLPGADGERAADGRGCARQRDRAALGRLPGPLRPLLAPPGLVAGDGRRPAAAGAARDRGDGRRDPAALRPAAAGRLGPRERAATSSAGAGRYDLALERRPGRLTLTAERRSGSGEISLRLRPRARARRARALGRGGRACGPAEAHTSRRRAARRGLRARTAQPRRARVRRRHRGDRAGHGAAAGRAQRGAARPARTAGEREPASGARGSRRPKLHAARALGAPVGRRRRGRGARAGARRVGGRATFEGPADGYRRRELALPLGPR